MAQKKVPSNPTKDLKFTKGKQDVFSIRLPTELINAVEVAAKEQGWSKSEFVQMVLDQYLTHTGFKK